jgi:dipeptidyl aminopeptidase/acylaminoacyl peptidase
VVGLAASAAEKSLISIDDLYRTDAPTGLVVSPDGQTATYSRRWADRGSRTIRQSLWIVRGKADDRQPLEPGEPDARQPLFSPDGKWIVFLSTRPLPDGTPAFNPVPPYSDPATDIWLIPTAGGKAIPLAGKNKPYGRVLSDPFYGRVAFAPDGERLVFVADDGRDPRTPEEIANRVQIVREDQGEGYEGYGPAQIWIADLAESPGDVAASKITRVTHDDNWYGDPQWFPNGRSLVVHANLAPGRESVRYSINKNYDLWRIDLADGKLQQLTTGPGPEVSPRFSPDGKRLLCLSIPRRGSHMDVFNLLLVELGDSGSRSRVLFDHHGADASPPPHLPPSFPLPADCWLTPDRVHFSAAHRTGSKAQVIDIARGPAALPDVSPESATEDRTKLSQRRRELTPPGDTYLQDRIVAQGQVISWKSDDGLEIEGIFTPPTKPDVRQPFPLVLYPHGGPHSRSAVGFDFTVQVLAANGYAVFQPNFRGSAAYGQKFLDADRYDLGGRDMRDILTGIDHLVSQKLIDPQRQFVYGVSYGGFTTSWLIGQTNQFRAAVPQNAVTDLNVMWGLSDIPSWTEWEFGGRPWEVPQGMRDHSPLTHAPKVRTPTLVIHAANDRRCPLPMGLMYHRALQRNGVETQMVIYPDEGHPIKQLPHQEDVLRRVLDWFARHDGPAK